MWSACLQCVRPVWSGLDAFGLVIVWSGGIATTSSGELVPPNRFWMPTVNRSQQLAADGHLIACISTLSSLA